MRLFGGLLVLGLLAPGVALAVGEPCTDNSGCAIDVEYCRKADGDCAGAGACEVRPEGCWTVYEPVCGCSGVTQSNACYGGRDGDNVAHKGICLPPPVNVTASDGVHADRVRVSWAPVAGLVSGWENGQAGYLVERSTTGVGGPFHGVGNVGAGAGEVFEDLDPCLFSAWYRVIAWHAYAASPASAADAGYANTRPVALPGGPYAADLGAGTQFDGSGSSDPDEACGDWVAGHSWNIGSGRFVRQGNPATLFAADVSALGTGVFPVVLTVTDRHGRASEPVSTTLTVYRNEPTAAFTATPATPRCGQEVTFDGGSSTNGRPDRQIVSYSWDLDGDGAFGDAAGRRIVVPFVAPLGSRTVRLRVTDDNDPPRWDDAAATVSIPNSMPVPVPGGPYAVDLGQGVTLDGSASHDPDEPCGDAVADLSWRIAGGLVSLAGVAPSLTAEQVALLGPGEHAVQLLATDAQGWGTSAFTTLTIAVPPGAVALVTPAAGAAVGTGSALDCAWAAEWYVAGAQLFFSPTGDEPWSALSPPLDARDGLWRWEVPVGQLLTARGARLKVVGTDAAGGALAEDAGTGPFALGPVVVDAPAGGARLAGGAATTVSWRTWGTKRRPASALVQVSADGGPWTRIASAPGDPGEVAWRPELPTRRYAARVRVTLRDAAGVPVARDVTPPFTVLGPGELRRPAAGETLAGGAAYPIAWRWRRPAPDPVSTSIDYSLDGGSTWVAAATVPGVLRSWEWTVPEPPGGSAGSCRVRLTFRDAAGRAVARDQGDGPFSIAPALAPPTP